MHKPCSSRSSTFILSGFGLPGRTEFPKTEKIADRIARLQQDPRLQQ